MMCADNTSKSRDAYPTSGAWALALAPAAMLCVLLLRHVWDVDIFWQLRLGELILERGGPVTHEPFAATHIGEPLPAVAWLGQALFAAVRRAGGWTGLRLFDALCWCGGFWAIAAASRHRGASAGSVALALALSFVVALPTASIRPQSYGALCFGLLLALLKLGFRPWLTVAVAIPLLLVWQNLHPSASIAVVALAAHAGGGWAAWFRDRLKPRPWTTTMLVPIALASLFATPDGLAALAISARNAQASMLVGASEWLPLWTPANLANALPVLSLALFVVWLVRRRGWRVDWPDAAVMLVLLAMTITAYRFVLFWTIATVPVISALRRPDAQSVAPAASKALMAAALAIVALVTPLLRPTHFSDNLPLAAVASLEATQVRGTIFTEPEFGGAIIDVGYPRWLVSYDGRYYRYTDEEWGRFGNVLGGTVRLREIVRRYRPSAFLLRPTHSTPLCDELDRPSSGWRRIYKDEGAAVWVPAARR